MAELRGRGRVAVACLWLFVLAQMAELATGLAMYAARPGASLAFAAPGLAMAWGLVAIVQFLLYVASGVTVLLWLHRASADAHALVDGLSISPGWAVGWFFVPIANLVKPFTAVSEAWRVSHAPEDWAFAPVPALLRWWWGAWIASNVLAGLDWRLNRAGGGAAPTVTLAGLAGGIAALASALLLAQVVRRLSTAQSVALAGRVFA